MSAPPDLGFLGLGKVVDWLIAGVSALAGLVWKLFDHRMKKVEAVAAAALPREEFETARQEAKDDRAELRSDMRDLFAKTESLRELIDTKLERQRSDMNGGFESLRAEMRGRGGL